MNHKTAMVSVPRELLERLISATKVARGEGSPTQRDAEAILTAPSERGHALLDEPAAWMTQCLWGDKVGIIEQTEGPDSIGNLEYWSPAFPVYRQPHYSALLPERKPESYKTSVGLIPYHEGWNACIDEFERLNR